MKKLIDDFSFAGLDVGADFVKLVQADMSKGSGEITAAACEKVELEENAEDTQTAFARAISKCFSSSGISTRNVIAGLSGQDTIIREFNLGKLPKEQLESAISFEAKQTCPFDISKGTVDHQLYDITDKDGRVSGLLAAATNESIFNMTSLIEKGGGKCIILDLNDLALLNLALRTVELGEDQAVTVIDIGSKLTNIAIVDKEQRPYTRDMSFAIEDIVRKMAKVTGKESDKVRAMLKNAGEERDDNFDEFLAAAMEEMVDGICDTIRSYCESHAGVSVERALLCGGCAVNEVLVESLCEQLPVEVCVWNPFEKLTINDDINKELIKDFAPGLAVAAGLAMRELN